MSELTTMDKDRRRDELFEELSMGRLDPEAAERIAREEGLKLAAEIAITHGLLIDFLHKAKRAQYLPQLEAQGRLAAKLMRALAGHIQLLAKLQRGGEQTVRVEHVHAYAGGQAVAGHAAVGGGGQRDPVDQPHAP